MPRRALRLPFQPWPPRALHRPAATRALAAVTRAHADALPIASSLSRTLTPAPRGWGSPHLCALCAPRGLLLGRTGLARLLGRSAPLLGRHAQPHGPRAPLEVRRRESAAGRNFALCVPTSAQRGQTRARRSRHPRRCQRRREGPHGGERRYECGDGAQPEPEGARQLEVARRRGQPGPDSLTAQRCATAAPSTRPSRFARSLRPRAAAGGGTQKGGADA